MEVGQISASLGNAAAGVVSAIGNLIPSVGAKGSTGSNQVDFIAPSANFTDARASEVEGKSFVTSKAAGVEKVDTS